MGSRVQPLLLLTLAAVAAAFVVLYESVFVDVAGMWMSDANYSHGPLLLLAVAYLIWARRGELAATELRPSVAGLLVVAASLATLLVGTAGVEFFMMRISAVGVVAGAVVFLAGWGWLRLLMLPLFLTVLTIPVPPVIFYQATFPLQLLATRFGVAALQLFQIPVLRDGNVITLAHTTLEVTEACSGIRSLVSLFALAILYGHFADSRRFARMTIALSAIPVAVVANGVRVAGTGIAAQYIGPAAATGFLHTFSGWVVFMASFVLLTVIANTLRLVPMTNAVPRSQVA
jgi:exosortase